MAGAHQRATFSVQIDGINRFRKAVRSVGNLSADNYRAAMEAIGRDLAQETRARAPGAMASRTAFAKLTGTAQNTRALVIVDHPGATSYEFGRTYDKRHGKLPHGQQAKPFAGIKEGDEAIGATLPRAKQKIWDALQADYEAAWGGPTP